MAKRVRNPIQIGSAIRVVIPKFVERVGYPRDLKYYSQQVEARQGDQIRNLVANNSTSKWFEYNNWRSVKAYEEILQALAWRAGHADGWGGRERSIHFVEKSEFLNKEGWAQGFKRCVTGTYSPGYRTGGYDYDEWEPPYLYNQKHHRLVELCLPLESSVLWIPDYHLEFIK